MRIFWLALCIASSAAAQKPAVSRTEVARMEVLHIPSAGLEIFGVAIWRQGPTASDAGDRPWLAGQ